MSRTATSHLLLSIISLFTPAAVEAEQVTWAFEGIVTYTLGHNFVGSLLSGQYTFEVGVKEYPIYRGGITDIHGSLGAFDFEGPLDWNYIEIANGQGGWDWYRMASSIGLVGQPWSFEIELIDGDGTIFDSSHLQSSPPSLSKFEVAYFRFYSPGEPMVHGNITRLTYVPEPTTAVLLLAGVSWICGKRKSRKM